MRFFSLLSISLKMKLVLASVGPLAILGALKSKKCGGRVCFQEGHCLVSILGGRKGFLFFSRFRFFFSAPFPLEPEKVSVTLNVPLCGVLVIWVSN